MGFYVRDKKTGELRRLLIPSTGENAGTTNYNLLENIPSINSKQLKGSLSLEDLGVSNIVHEHILSDIEGLIVSVEELNRLAGLDQNIMEKFNAIPSTGGTEGGGGEEGGEGSTSPSVVSYSDLTNKPSINGIELVGILTSDDLGFCEKEHVHSYDQLSNIPTFDGVQWIGALTSDDFNLEKKGHTHSYNDLENIPKINGEYVVGEKTLESFGFASAEHTHILSDIQGVTATANEINFLSGLDENIMNKVSKITSGNIIGYPTSFSSYSDLLAFDFSTLKTDSTYLMYVSEDETRDSNSTVYLATYTSNNTDNLPSYAGLGSFVQRDFTVNKLDLGTEVKGKLPLNMIDSSSLLTAEALSSYMKINDYASSVNAESVKKADTALKLYGISQTNAQISEAVGKAHVHSNKTTLDLFSMDSSRNLSFDGKQVITDIPESMLSLGIGEW